MSRQSAMGGAMAMPSPLLLIVLHVPRPSKAPKVHLVGATVLPFPLG